MGELGSESWEYRDSSTPSSPFENAGGVSLEAAARSQSIVTPSPPF